ncbi:periplasmic binding protein-like I [Blastocladiella britannica]|nr:periplasmic binding protein-like I [Blastocladiella britannica]
MTYPSMKLMWVTLAIILASVCSIPHCHGNPTTFNIGILLPMLTPSLGVFIPQIVEFLHLMAPDLNQLDPSGTYRFELVDVPTNYTQRNATLAVQRALLRSNIYAGVGDYASFATIPESLVGAQSNLFMCSGSATSTDLSVKATHPWFFRTISDDPQQGRILAQFVIFMGWSSVSILAGSDSYGHSVSVAFLEKASTLGITIASTQVFNPGDADFTAQLSSVINAGSRIILLCAVVPQGLLILRQAKKLGLIGPQYVWLGPESYSSFGSLDLLPGDIDLVNGMLFTFPREDSYNAAYNSSVQRWQTQFPGRPPMPLMFLFQDCVTALAKGILASIDRVGLATFLSRDYVPDMASTFYQSFTGLSGDIVYDGVGNRVAYFSILNWYNGTQTEAYQVAPDMSILPGSSPILFHSGTSVVPRDRPLQVALVATWSSATGVILATLNLVAIALILLTLVYITFHREGAAVKAMSYPAMALISVGCTSVLVGNLLQLDVPSNAQCVASLWSFVLGAQLVLATGVAKTFRIWRIFDNKALSKLGLTPSVLVATVGAMTLVQILLLAIWTVLAPPFLSQVSTATYYYYSIKYSGTVAEQAAMQGLTLAYNAVLLAAFLTLAFKTRSVALAFRESVTLFYTAQNIVLAGVALALLSFFEFGSASLAVFSVRQALVVYGAMSTFGLLVGRAALTHYASSHHLGSHLHSRKRSLGAGIDGLKTYSPSRTDRGDAPAAVESGSRRSVGNTSAAAAGEPVFLRGEFPVRKGSSMFSTWHKCKVTYNSRDSTCAIPFSCCVGTDTP